jgi:hypothetical protein
MIRMMQVMLGRGSCIEVRIVLRGVCSLSHNPCTFHDHAEDRTGAWKSNLAVGVLHSSSKLNKDNITANVFSCMHACVCTSVVCCLCLLYLFAELWVRDLLLCCKIAVCRIVLQGVCSLSHNLCTFHDHAEDRTGAWKSNLALGVLHSSSKLNKENITANVCSCRHACVCTSVVCSLCLLYLFAERWARDLLLCCKIAVCFVSLQCPSKSLSQLAQVTKLKKLTKIQKVMQMMQMRQMMVGRVSRTAVCMLTDSTPSSHPPLWLLRRRILST